MPGPLGGRDFYTYTSDDGNDYTVHISDALAASGGFSASSSDKVDYPRGWKMRHVYGEQTDGTRIAIPVADPGFALFVTGGSTTVYGQSYDCGGGIGEKRPRA